MAVRLQPDGIVDFSGGMDSYSSPSLLAKNQYAYSINCQIKPGKEGITTRPGYREISLSFDNKKTKEIFESGEIQGNGNYITRDNILIILASVDGYILEFKQSSVHNFHVSAVPVKNDDTAKKAYFTSIPNGCMINDGISGQIHAKDQSYNRVNGLGNVTAGRAGIYVQNRYFYIDEYGQSIIPSNYNDPTSLTERVINNVTAFLSPDETEIKAIGVQRAVNKDTQGGSLLFSTRDNIYSTDISGPMSQWGQPNGFGSVTGAVFDVAAVSPFSFLPANSNVYFRSRDLGLASLQYMQYIWNNVDIVEAQSYGGHLFFNNDPELYLDCCYSAKCNNNIYTTVSPSLSRSSVYWEGILVCRPGQKGVIRYDSLYTGIRPWCFQTVKNQHGRETLYIFSKDYDDKNRLYILDESLDYDLTLSQNPKKNISSVFTTRFFNFNNPLLYKKCNSNQANISTNSEELKLIVASRLNSDTSFSKAYEVTIKDTKCAIDTEGYKPKVAEGKNDVVNYSDKISAEIPFIHNQQMLCFTGAFNLNNIIRTATEEIPEKPITREKPKSAFSEYVTEKFFTYKLYGE